MNYVAAFVLCFACTLLSALGKSTEVKWLLMSDINVALWLFVAYFLGRKRQ